MSSPDLSVEYCGVEPNNPLVVSFSADK